MPASFAEIAEGLRDLARWERERVRMTEWLAIRGQARELRGAELQDLLERTARIEKAAEIFALLIPLEDQVRAMHPALRHVRPS